MEAELSNLEGPPASARIAGTAANGGVARLRGDAFPADLLAGGHRLFDGASRGVRLAAALGDLSFTYQVTVTLDGKDYPASASCLADEIRGDEMSAVLNFTTALGCTLR